MVWNFNVLLLAIRMIFSFMLVDETSSLKLCPNCYKAFEREITLALKKIQGRTYHTGKTPYENELDKKLLEKYRSLIAEKARAERDERFADVESLSSEILELVEELKNRGLI